MSSEFTIATRESLLARLKQWDDHESWQEFFDMYGRLIHGVARKARLGEEEAEDVVQETIIAVSQHLPGFQYDRSRCMFRT